MLYTYIDILHRKCYFICRRKKITDKVDEEFSMLRKFKVRNYKNFKETLEFDFTKVSGYAFNRECVNSEIISKCIIYGRNATGKTNLGKAFSDLTEIVEGRIHLGRNERILNADSDEDKAVFSYEFQFGADYLSYEYKKNVRNELCEEKLEVNNICVFSVDFETGTINDLNLSIINAETIQIEKYIEIMRSNLNNIEDEDNGRIPFIRYILSNALLPIGSALLQFDEYVRRMRFFSGAQQYAMNAHSRILEAFSDYLGEEAHLRDFEQFLNAMGIACKLKTVQTIDGHYELYFDYQKLVPFYDNTSSGTKSLMTFYRRYIMSMKNPSFIFMDEFDAFYHYEMADKLVQYLKTRYTDCQVVLTTHNTNLMTNHLMRPDCLFILSRDGRLTALCDATERELREGHNLEKLYIGGEFERYE